ncbi:hypothetical protein [Streptomyces sp. KL116D]|uniref:hypothetical protein n=1 Tax=Streptomyces sp. KL116D TaxID=3045152 RepID=UPI0035587311
MSLLTLPAFKIRRKEAAMPETVTDPTKTEPNVLMRFLTQGGATVELHRQERRVRTRMGASSYLLPNDETRVSNGFNWRCLGCDSNGGRGRYGLGDGHFDETQQNDARDEANDHAERCRAMPKPEA